MAVAAAIVMPALGDRSGERLELERALVFRRHPTPFCPSAALPEAGSYITREAADMYALESQLQDLEAELEYLPDGRLLLRRSKWGPIR